MQGTVYVLRPKGSKNRKVGFTTQDPPEKRVRALQTGSEQELIVEALLPTPNAAETEAEMHRLLAPSHVRGEFYAADLSTVLAAYRVAMGRGVSPLEARRVWLVSVWSARRMWPGMAVGWVAGRWVGVAVWVAVVAVLLRLSVIHP